MGRAARVIHLVAAAIAFLNAVAAVFVYAKIGLGAEPSRAGLGSAEAIDLFLWAVAVPVIAAILWCSVRFQSCSLRTIAWLTACWIGVYTWLYWFGASPAWQMYEVHSFDPQLIRAERFRHIVWTSTVYGGVVVIFGLLPILKFLHVRRGALHV